MKFHLIISLSESCSTLFFLGSSLPLLALLKCGIVYTGATRPQYAPEPLDVGKKLKVEIELPDDKRESLVTSGPIDGGK